MLMLFLLFVCCAFALAQTPPKPKLWPTWEAHVAMVVEVGGIPLDMDGALLYDAAGRQTYLQLHSKVFGERLDYISLAAPTAARSGFVANSQCRRANPFSPWFAWIDTPAARYMGTEQVNGRTCDLWKLDVPSGVKLVACTTQHEVLRLSTFKGNKPVNMTMTNIVQTNSIPQSLPAYCSAPPATCTNGRWRDVDMFRLHNVHDTALANRNFGSPAGDLLYICSAVLADDQFLAGNETVVSHFKVSANTTYGQYALCNHNACLGGDKTTVGHEYTMGLGQNGGQCTTNTTIGDWWSLTEEAQCGPNDPIGTPNCAWKLNKRVKSAAMPCLLQNGLKAACAQDAKNNGFPFAASAQILLDAVDPKNPMCADAPPQPTPMPTPAPTPTQAPIQQIETGPLHIKIAEAFNDLIPI